ncbi:MAG: hypothetical protein U0263_03790 [Polyangiaceae bacterium]
MVGRRRKTTVEPLSDHLDGPSRRINVNVLESQHETLVQQGVNVSALIRALLDAYLSSSVIMLPVDKTTRELYDLVLKSTGYSDSDVGAHLGPVLKQLLETRRQELDALSRRFKGK